jgi:parallel beta-helix repeat protein
MAFKVIVTDEATLQAALNSAVTSPITCISLEPLVGDTISVANAIFLPRTLANASNKLIIEGNGITLRPTSPLGLPGNSILYRKNPAQDNTSSSFIIRDIKFDGRNRTTSGLELCNATDSIIENCTFSDVVNGLVLRNDYNTTVNNCSVLNHSGYAYAVDFGDWQIFPNVTTYSRKVTFNECRQFGFDAGTSYGWYFNGVTGAAMYECTSEGKNYMPIFFDSLGLASVLSAFTNTPAVSNFNVTNFTIAGSIGSTGAGIRLKLIDGYAKITGLHTTTGGTLIYASAYSDSSAGASPNPHLYVENIPYLNGTAKFQTDGGITIGCPIPEPSNVVVWEFKEVYDGNIIFSATRWVNSLIPYHRYAEYFQESKKITTNSITVNGNPI